MMSLFKQFVLGLGSKFWETAKTALHRRILVVTLLIIAGIIVGSFIAYKVSHPKQTTPNSMSETKNTSTPAPSTNNQRLPLKERTDDGTEEQKRILEETVASGEQTVKCLGADRKYSWVEKAVCEATQKFWTTVNGFFPSNPDEIIKCKGADGKNSFVQRNLCEIVNNFWAAHPPPGNSGSSGSNGSSSSSSDTTAPATIDNTDSSWHATPVTIALTCTDNSSGCDKTYYTTDGSIPTTSSTQGTSFTLTSGGTYAIKYFSVDKSGNQEIVKTATNTVKIDTTPPSTPGTSSTTSPTGNNKPTWTWAASTDSGSGLATPAYTLQWSQDINFGSGVNSATANTNSFTHSSSLADGTWYFKVKATDAIANASAYASNGSVVVDTTAPSVPGTPSVTTPVTNNKPNWSWTTSTDSGAGLATNAYSVQWCTDSSFSGCGANVATSTTNSFTHSVALADGTWYFRAKATDSVNNVSTFSGNGSVTIDTSTLHDTFTGTGALTAHTPDVAPVGSSWSIKNGGFGSLSGGQVPSSSGTYGDAIIDTGLADVEITSSMQFSGNQPGILIRSATDGKIRTMVWVQVSSSTLFITRFTDLATENTTSAGFVVGVNAAPALNTLKVWVWKNTLTVWVNGVFATRYTATDLSNTFVGLGWRLVGGSWDSVQVVPARTGKNITYLGDSIAAQGTGFAFLVSNQYNQAYNRMVNWAVGGYSIMVNMATEVANAASDDADIIIIELGTNDGNDPNITATYQANLTTLKTSNPRAQIYCMGILDRTGDQTNRNANNPRIQTAAGNAGCTYWNTDGWIDPTIGVDTVDGLHPNAAGAAKIAAQILSRLP